MYKKLLLALFATSLGFASVNADTFSIDPAHNSGTPLFSSVNAAATNIMPKIVMCYIPSGNMIQNYSNAQSASAPNIGAVEGVILLLAHLFQGTAGTSISGNLIWTIPMNLIIFGLFLSTFLTWQAVAQGKKTPGEGIVGIITKAFICILLFQFVCPNLPSFMIGMCDDVTVGLNDWFVPGKTEQESDQLLKSTFNTKMLQSAILASHIMQASVDAILTQASPSAAKAMVDAISKDKIIKDGTATGVKDFTKNSPFWGEIKTYDPSKANTAIGVAATANAKAVQEEINKIVSDNLPNSKNAPNGPQASANEAVKTAIASATRGFSPSQIQYPARVLVTNAYCALTILGIGIWGTAIASLLWVAFFSMPEEWQMGGVLFSGVKTIVGTILTCLLISVYISAGSNWEDKQVLATVQDIQDSNSGYLAQAETKISQLLSSTKDLSPVVTYAKTILQAIQQGGVAGVVSGMLGITFSQLMIGALILSSPAQAMAMIRGANGIGEQAATAMHAGGGSSQGWLSSITGQHDYGQSSVSSQSSVASAMDRGNMRPSPPNP